ncbi:MAG TPA: diguanylate cyclase, partial [Gammaproteobacteria bacterium]|nr:diguanylate cyclase [Gammaproteobacteria bacterium]
MSASRKAVAKGTARGSAKSSLALRQAEERLQCVIELAADFYWEQDAEHRFAVYRPRGESDADLAAIVGKTSWELCDGPPADGGRWDRHRAVLDAHQAFRDVVHRFGAKGAAARYVSFSGQPVFDAKGAFSGYRGIGRDVTAETRADRLAHVEHVIARILSENDDVNEALRSVVRALCEYERWSAGHFWTVDEQSGALRPCVSWSHGDEGRHSVLEAGAAVPDWLGADPVFIADVAGDPRTLRPSLRVRTGWNTSLVVPILSAGALVGVLDFYAPRIAAPDPLFLRVLRAAAAELGHFFQRALTVERLRDSEERFSSTMELAAIGIAHVDDAGRFVYANPQLCEMLDYTEAELLALTVKQVSHPGDVNVTDELGDKLRSGAIKSFKMEKRYLRKDGSPIWVGLTIACKRDRTGKAVYDISVVEDISARKRAEERVQYLATHDGLTGLPNRAMFGQLLNLAIETAKRYDRRFAVLFIDLDRFKVINDTLGHEAGDVLLREMAARLRECLRASDVVARLGGDEFVLLLQEVKDSGQVSIVARNILSAVMKPVVILGQECRVTASIGVCMHPEEGQDDQAVMKNA